MVHPNPRSAIISSNLGNLRQYMAVPNLMLEQDTGKKVSPLNTEGVDTWERRAEFFSFPTLSFFHSFLVTQTG